MRMMRDLPLQSARRRGRITSCVAPNSMVPIIPPKTRVTTTWRTCWPDCKDSELVLYPSLLVAQKYSYKTHERDPHSALLLPIFWVGCAVPIERASRYVDVRCLFHKTPSLGPSGQCSYWTGQNWPLKFKAQFLYGHQWRNGATIGGCASELRRTGKRSLFERGRATCNRRFLYGK